MNRTTTTVLTVLMVFLLTAASLAATITYTYDKKGQLTKVDYGDGKAIDYTYDAAGNRVNTGTCVAKSTNPSTAQNTIQAAYNAAAPGGVIKIRDLTFVENDDLNIVKSVTVKGGYDCSFASNASYSMLQGSMSISKGTVVLERIVIK